jgi:fluoride ion exporter CrcB/FEX
MASYFWIALGRALGGIARFWCSGFLADLIGETFPGGTLLINVIASFVIGPICDTDGAQTVACWLDRSPGNL